MARTKNLLIGIGHRAWVNLREVESCQDHFWMLHFSRESGIVKLVESLFRRSRKEDDIWACLLDLPEQISLTALGIAAILARCAVKQGRGHSDEVEVVRSQRSGTWPFTLVDMTQKHPKWIGALFGSAGNEPFCVHRKTPTTPTKGKSTPNKSRRGKHTRKKSTRKSDLRSKDAACGFPSEKARNIRIFVSQRDAGGEMCELITTYELLNLAADLEQQHRDDWPIALVERPVKRILLELDDNAPERHALIVPLPGKRHIPCHDGPELGILSNGYSDPSTRAALLNPQYEESLVLQVYNSVRDDALALGKLVADCRYFLALEILRVACNGFVQLPRGALLPDEGTVQQLFKGPFASAQLPVVLAHLRLLPLINRHVRADDPRTAYLELTRPATAPLPASAGRCPKKGRTKGPSGQRVADSETQRLLELDVPDPLLYDLSLDLNPKLPLCSQDRLLSPSQAHHPASASVVVHVSLLEPVTLKLGEPIQLRAVPAWLTIECVPVPRHDNGDLLWQGGTLYPAADCRLQDQDTAWQDQLETAQQLVSLPTNFDFRWSLARREGKPLPPILLGDHLGAAFALALGKLAGLAPLKDLHFRGYSIFGALNSQHRFASTTFAPALFHAALEEAARAGEIHSLLAAPDSNWPNHWQGQAASPIRVERCADLRTVADALRPASLVIEAERKAAEYIEFLTGKVPIASHYQDLALLCEVPRAKLRERRTPELNHALPPGAAPGFIADGTNSLEHTVLIHDREQRLHDSAWTLNRTPIGWRELFSSFSTVCPQVQSNVAQFILIGVPGSGKSTFVQYVLWLVCSGEEPFARTSLLAIRVNLREWEDYCTSGDHSPQLEDYLANTHPASRQPGGPTQEWWRHWLESGRLILLLDGLDEVKADGPFAGKLISSLTDWRGRFPIVLTCRTLNIDAHRSKLARWPIFAPANLSPEQVHHFIKRYPRLKGHLKTAKLKQQLRKYPEMLSLAEVPLLLNVMCFVVDDGLKLPAARHELYSVAVDRLLERTHDPPLDVLSPANPRHRATARRILAEVAARHFRANQGLKPLEPNQFDQALEEASHQSISGEPWEHRKDDLEKWFLQRSGLIRASRAGYTFLHNQFLEFLAGEGLAADPAFATHVEAAVRDVDSWREVVKYAAAHKLLSRGPLDESRPRLQAVCDLLCALAGASEPITNLGWRKAVLAGEIILDLGLGTLELDQPQGDGCLRLVRERLVALIERESLPQLRQGRSGLNVHERARAGEVLGWLGDPRPGVGTIVVGTGDQTGPLPHFRWCGPEGEVRGSLDVSKAFSAGPFLMGGDASGSGSSRVGFECTRIKERFFISKYPVTVAQYEVFVCAEGYGRPNKPKPPWWSHAGWEWRKKTAIMGPENYMPVFQTPNHPRVGVSWHEVRAFCDWLNRNEVRRYLGLPNEAHIGLPTEAERERAARWPDYAQRHFPWGNCDDVAERCNCEAARIGHTSAVGLFPGGYAACGAADLAGNVWEWCQTKYTDLNDQRDCEQYNASTTIDHNDGDEYRALRGGSWYFSDPGCLCTANRIDSPPHSRDENCGFRVVVRLRESR